MRVAAFCTRRPRSWWLAVGWLTVVCLAALLAPIASSPPDFAQLSQPPFLNTGHWLGTNAQGLDVGQALLQGARTVVVVSVPATLLTFLLGAVLGSLAGFLQNTRWQISPELLLSILLPLASSVIIGPRWLVAQLLLLPGLAALLWLGGRRAFRGWRAVPIPVDTLVMGMISLLDSLPLLVLVLIAAAVQRPSLSGLLILLSLTCWTTPARLMRAATLQVKVLPYTEAAEAAGLPAAQIIRRHIWPNTWQVLLTRFPLTVAMLIGFETTLSFLGVGLPPEVPSWGRLLAGIRQSPTDWWLLAWPGLALVLTILSLQMLTRRK